MLENTVNRGFSGANLRNLCDLSPSESATLTSLCSSIPSLNCFFQPFPHVCGCFHITILTMADEERRSSKRSRFDQTEADPKRSSRFDRRSRSPTRTQPESKRNRSPLNRASPLSPGSSGKSASDPAAAAGKHLQLVSERHASGLILWQLLLLHA